MADGQVFSTASIEAAQNGEVQATASTKVLQNGIVSIIASMAVLQLGAVQAVASIEVSLVGQSQVTVSLAVKQNSGIQPNGHDIDASIEVAQNGMVEADASMQCATLIALDDLQENGVNLSSHVPDFGFTTWEEEVAGDYVGQDNGMISTGVFQHARSGQDLAVADNYRVYCDMKRNSTDSAGESGLLLLNGNGAKILGSDEHLAVGWERINVTTVAIKLFRRNGSHQSLQTAFFDSSFAFGTGATQRFIFVLKFPVIECFVAPLGQNSPKTFVGSVTLTGEIRVGRRLGIEAGLSGVGATNFGFGASGELALYQLGPGQLINQVQIAASMEVRQKSGEVQIAVSMAAHVSSEKQIAASIGAKQNSGLLTAHAPDFKVQRISTVLTGTLKTLVAGVDYDAPASVSSVYARIVGVRSCAHGPKDNTTLPTGPEDDGSAFLDDPDNILTNLKISRNGSAFNLDVEIEIVEYIGPPGGPNEFISRGSGDFPVTSSASEESVGFTDGVNVADIVPFLTSMSQVGSEGGSFHRQQFITEVFSITTILVKRSPIFLGSAMRGSIAVVEFTGANWRVQRLTKNLGGVSPDSVAIPTTVVKSRTMLHCQQRIRDAGQTEAFSNSVEHRGHLAEVSADGTTLDYALAAINGNEQVAVTWLIENLDTAVNTKALVQHETDTEVTGAAPHAWDVVFGTSVRALDEASVMAEDAFRTLSSVQTWPDGIFDAKITALDTIELETGRASILLVYQVELVQWPRGPSTINQIFASMEVAFIGDVQISASVAVSQNGQVQSAASMVVEQHAAVQAVVSSVVKVPSEVQIVASIEVDATRFTDPFPAGRNDMLIAISGRASRVGQRLRRR